MKSIGVAFFAVFLFTLAIPAHALFDGLYLDLGHITSNFKVDVGGIDTSRVSGGGFRIAISTEDASDEYVGIALEFMSGDEESSSGSQIKYDLKEVNFYAHASDNSLGVFATVGYARLSFEGINENGVRVKDKLNLYPLAIGVGFQPGDGRFFAGVGYKDFTFVGKRIFNHNANDKNKMRGFTAHVEWKF